MQWKNEQIPETHQVVLWSVGIDFADDLNWFADETYFADDGKPKFGPDPHKTSQQLPVKYWKQSYKIHNQGTRH